MRVLTLHQPWAWAIIHAGKTVENRPWHTGYRGRFAVHAGMSYWTEDAAWIANEFGIRVPGKNDVVHGAIIGTVELYDVVTDATAAKPVMHDGRRVDWLPSDPWAVAGKFHWLLRDPVALEKPVPCRGRQGWFNVDDALLAKASRA